MRRKQKIVQIYQLYKWELFRYIHRVVKSTSIAEDVLQEVFFRLCRLDNFDDIKNYRAFLFTTSRNLAIDHIRSRNRSVIDDRIILDDMNFASTDKTAEDNLILQEEVDLLYQAIRSLPKQRRRAFIHKKMLNRSYKEISSDFGTAISTLEKHVRAAMADCSGFMNDRAVSLISQQN